MKSASSLAAIALLAMATAVHAAEGGATAEQATAMVKKGVAFIKATNPGHPASRPTH